MAWSRKKVDSQLLNNNNEYTKDSQLSNEALNGIVNSGLYSQDFVEHLADTPDVSEAGNVGTPTVTLVDNPNATTDKPYKRFKFSNLKGEKGDKGDKGDTGDSYVLTSSDKSEIAEETAELVSYVQPNEPQNALEGTLWVDTDEDSDSVTQNLLCKINDGINVIDTELTYSRGVVEVRKIGSIIWVIDSGVYNFTDSFSAKNSRTVLEFTLPKSISNCIHNANGVYGTTGTISYFPALAYENVNYSTFNCQSYLKRSAIGETYDTFQMVYTGVNAISGGGLCGFHSKMPVIMVQQEGGNN